MEDHGCCWETFYIFAYCGSVVEIPTELLKCTFLLPFQRQGRMGASFDPRRRRPTKCTARRCRPSAVPEDASSSQARICGSRRCYLWRILPRAVRTESLFAKWVVQTFSRGAESNRVCFSGFSGITWWLPAIRFLRCLALQCLVGVSIYPTRS